MSDTPTRASAARIARCRRSTWHQLLRLLEVRHRTQTARLADLVGATQDVMRTWLEAAEPMPLARQWRMAVLADALYGTDPTIHRLALTLRSQLEARAAYLGRGQLNPQAVPEMYR